MTAIFKVKASSTVPVARASWQVEIPGDLKDQLIYTNLGYDLIAYAMAELGVAMSEHLLGKDDKLNKLAAKVHGRVE